MVSAGEVDRPRSQSLRIGTGPKGGGGGLMPTLNQQTNIKYLQHANSALASTATHLPSTTRPSHELIRRNIHLSWPKRQALKHSPGTLRERCNLSFRRNWAIFWALQSLLLPGTPAGDEKQALIWWVPAAENKTPKVITPAKLLL